MHVGKEGVSGPNQLVKDIETYEPGMKMECNWYIGNLRPTLKPLNSLTQPPPKVCREGIFEIYVTWMFSEKLVVWTSIWRPGVFWDQSGLKGLGINPDLYINIQAGLCVMEKSTERPTIM